MKNLVPSTRFQRMKAYIVFEAGCFAIVFVASLVTLNSQSTFEELIVRSLTIGVGAALGLLFVYACVLPAFAWMNARVDDLQDRFEIKKMKPIYPLGYGKSPHP